jgi:S1-C subfamily serine protease
VKAQINVLSGADAGQVFVFSKSYIAVGRHPASDLRFNPDKELDVSSRHAAVLKQGDKWLVRDLGSRNGTLVNGHKVSGDLRLDDTDQIRFGAGGPTVEFRLVPDGTPDTGPARPQPTPAAAAALVATAAGAPAGRPTGTGTTQRIRVEVRRQTKQLRVVTTALLVVLFGVLATFVLVNQRQQRAREMEMAAMQARIDSVLRTADEAIASLKGQLAGLASALRQSQTEVSRLHSALSAAQQTGNVTQVAELRRQLDGATEALRHQQVASQVDYPKLWEAHQSAVAMIYVDFGPGQVFTGTAFAVSTDGVLITNRHVVKGADGNRTPTRIGIQFADSDQNFPARVLAVSTEADVAIIKVDIRGGTPSIGTLDASPGAVRPGDPVAVIGFPLGVDLPMSSRSGARIAQTSFTPGTVSKVLADRIQVDGYGAEGSSGSPILNREGHVVGILFGGQPGSGGRIVYGVPASHALRLVAPFLN